MKIVYNQVEEAISIMKEVAKWGREKVFVYGLMSG